MVSGIVGVVGGAVGGVGGGIIRQVRNTIVGI